MKTKEKLEPLHFQRFPDSVTLSYHLWQGICRLPKINQRSLAEWTDAIAHIVAGLCPEGLFVYGKQWKDEGRCEYLVDQCWRQHYMNQSGTRYLPGSILFAMECEWITNPLDQIHDFSKLLELRSPLALYIGGLSNWSKGYNAVVDCAILAKMHRSFCGEVVCFFFDRLEPDENFQVWRIARSFGAVEIEGPNNIGSFIKAVRCDAI